MPVDDAMFPTNLGTVTPEMIVGWDAAEAYSYAFDACDQYSPYLPSTPREHPNWLDELAVRLWLKSVSEETILALAQAGADVLKKEADELLVWWKLRGGKIPPEKPVSPSCLVGVGVYVSDLAPLGVWTEDPAPSVQEEELLQLAYDNGYVELLGQFTNGDCAGFPDVVLGTKVLEPDSMDPENIIVQAERFLRGAHYFAEWCETGAVVDAINLYALVTLPGEVGTITLLRGEPDEKFSRWHVAEWEFVGGLVPRRFALPPDFEDRLRVFTS